MITRVERRMMQTHCKEKDEMSKVEKKIYRQQFKVRQDKNSRDKNDTNILQTVR